MATKITIRNKVYDVSSYLDTHPGGADIIEECQGRDATVDFEYIGHSPDALNLLDTFYVKTLTPQDPGYQEHPKVDYLEINKISISACIYKLLHELYTFLFARKEKTKAE